ncbi:MAG: M42 family metallopeptidase [Bacillota bacterium]|nr:M42 family metallopeptidase [Bacillota bacterium]MDI7248727.1 M42 family metallopeptidase [Bacillota bacterium]
MLDLLRDLTMATGLPAFEHEVRAVLRKYLEDEVIEQDRLGSLIARREGKAGGPRVMLAGHMDEVGFMVTHITEKGFLRFQTLGGWWEHVMLAQRVLVKGREGDVPGIIGAKPPHILSPDDRKKMVEKKDMFIDVGASSREEVSRMGIRPGDPVVPDSPFQVMKNGRFLMAKAWDDRVGCAMFVEVLRRLRGTHHPNTVYGVGTVQEEVGLRGATTSAHVVNPDVAFALEVDIAGDTPGIAEHEAQARLGGGPSIILYDGSMVPNFRLRDLVIETAEKEGIPWQVNAMPGGGTDAGRIHINAAGVPSLVIGVPARYIHSHTGIIDREDFEKAVQLLLAVIGRLDEGTVASLAE